MALVVGQNSWETVAEADAYLADRLRTSDWDALSDSGTDDVTKEKLLVSTFWWLMGHPQLSLSATLTDANVKNAQSEGALFLLRHSEGLDERRAFHAFGVTSFSYSKRRESFDLSKLEVPQHILGLLKQYSVAGGAIITLRGEYDAD